MNKYLLLWMFIWIANLVWAQEDALPPVTNCYAITNATIVTKPGQTIDKGHIVIRNGVITEVGPNVKIPYDAQVIAADSMYVYAGFIAPYSNIGLKEVEKGKEDKEDKPKSPGEATMAQAGITPQLEVTTLLNPKSKSIEDMRKQGFVLAHTTPKGQLFKGSGCVINTKETSNVDELLMANHVSQSLSLDTKRGVFPSTLIGAMSRIREVIKNTELYQKNNQIYKLNPAGISRPAMVSEYEALLPVINKNQSVFFDASKPKEIHRAMTLKNELGFQMVLNEVKLVTPIQSMVPTTVPVLLSLDLPKEKKEDKEDKKEDKDAKDKKGDSDDKKDEKPEKPAKKSKKVSEEVAAKTKKVEEAYETYMTQAKVLSEKRHPWAFSYAEVKSNDVHKNIRRLVKAGLSETAALEALTTTPAQMLSLSNVAGSIEKGKLGNVVIFDKSYFDEKATIKYVFTEGQMHSFLDAKKKGKKSGEAVGDLSGTWRYTAVVFEEEQAGNLYIKKTGEGIYEVSIESDDEPGEVDQCTDVELDGNNLTFGLTITEEGQTMNLTMDIEFSDANTFSGTVNVAGFGSFPFSGDRRDRPDRN